MIDSKFFLHKDKTLLEALSQINAIGSGPLVLFVVDDERRMIGTLTDGDSRRALIAGASLYDKVEKIMHKNFNFLREGKNYDVKHLREQKQLKMRLVPILDDNNHIIDIVDLEKYVTKLPIDAVLMAGGKGERLRPLTEKTPKPLVKVGDKCIIDYNIDRLISYGIEHINVTVNYLKEQIEEHFSLPRNGIQVECVREPEFLGTMGSIQFVKEFYNDTILVMNSDLFTNIDFEDYFLHFQEHGAMMSVAAVPYTISIPYGIFELEGREIRGIEEKPIYHYYANAGIYLLKRSALELIPNNTFFNATDLIEAVMKSGNRVIRYPISGYWIDIGQHADLAKAQEVVKHMRF